MVTASSLRTSLVPLLLLAATSNYECQVNTAQGTGELHIFGTIRFISIEGGCWALDASNGRRFELRSDQVPDRLRQDGTRVAVIAVERDDWTGVCQVGSMLDVRQVAEAQN
jgi:hypothetical protein